MFKGLWLALLLGVGAFLIPRPEVKAFDPVTMGAMLPVAMNAFSTMSPYVMRGFSNAGGEMLGMGEATLNVMRLPLGVLQTTVLAPWCFSDGIYNVCRGAIAPIELGYHAVLMPVQLFNVF